MNIKLLLTGKTTGEFLKEGLADYSKRINRYSGFAVEEILVKTSSTERIHVLQQEADKIHGKLKNSDYLVLLDETGEELTSTEFASRMEQWQQKVSGNLVFVVGGAYGFHDDVYKRANYKMALSRMTFTHQMVRLIFVEQLYRAFTIIKNEKYHH
ncbi:MAG: 23S rRNA (pseudouridine(1915)-N(3))-methyltransferase RlmH [Bacteroidota bacterium]